MIAKTVAQRQREHRARRANAGRVRVEYWIAPEHRARLDQYVARLTRERKPTPIGAA